MNRNADICHKTPLKGKFNGNYPLIFSLRWQIRLANGGQTYFHRLYFTF